MRRSRQWLTVRGRLYCIAGVGALLTSVVGVLGLTGYARLNAANEAQVRLSTTQALALEVTASQHKVRAQVWFAYAATAEDTHGHDHEVHSPSQIRDEFEHASGRLREHAAHLSALSEGTPYEGRFRTLAADENVLLTQAEGLIQQAFTNRRAGLVRVDAFEKEADALDVRTLALAAELANDRATRQAAERDAERVDSITLLAAAILAALLGLGLSALLGRTVLRRLQNLAGVAHRIADGDLDARCVDEGGDEISDLSTAFNHTAASLSDTMQKLTAEARRQGFGSQLSEAFEMANTEAEAYSVIETAMQQLGPKHPTELLLADSSQAHLTARTASPVGGPPCCPVTSPFSCVAVRRGNAVVFDDSESINACPKLKDRPTGRLSAVCVPVTFMGRALGVLHSTGAPGQRPDAERLAGLTMLAGQAGARIGTLRSFERAQLQASTDGLTGLLNRRAFETEARATLRSGQSAAVVMADLDHFKLLNDTHGHEAGDRALRLFGQAVRTIMRDTDLAGRIGGEEFGFLLRNVTPQKACAIVERLRGQLRESATGGTPTFTASFGVVHTTGGESLDQLLRVADVALYRAKNEGRNRVVLADERDYRTDPIDEASERESAMERSARHEHLTDAAALR